MTYFQFKIVVFLQLFIIGETIKDTIITVATVIVIIKPKAYFKVFFIKSHCFSIFHTKLQTDSDCFRGNFQTDPNLLSSPNKSGTALIIVYDFLKPFWVKIAEVLSV